MGPQRPDYEDALNEMLELAGHSGRISSDPVPGAVRVGTLWLVTEEFHGTPGELYIQFEDDSQKTVKNWNDLKKAATRMLLKEGR